MTEHILSTVRNNIGFITLDRPKALNSLSLDMVRAFTRVLTSWHGDPGISAVIVHSTSEKAFCAGGDIRFFFDAGRATPQSGSMLIEDFFTEEYALNHLIHHYPKPYVALMDGIVMGGGMGIAQAGPANRMRIVTDRTKMAMPEVNIGLFPDVGGSFFLSRTPGKIGVYLGVTGETIGAADAIHADLADVFIPSGQIAALVQLLETAPANDVRSTIARFAEPFASQALPVDSALARNRAAIDSHFRHDDLQAIIASLTADSEVFAQRTLATMQKRSPLMMCVTLEQLRRGADMTLAECLRMERTMVRRSFEQGEVLEGIRALVIDKDNAPQWQPRHLHEVTRDRVENYFQPAWPEWAHPLRALE